MALDIRSTETDALASELARLTGDTKTAAVTRAIRDRRTTDEIVGYDRDGLPR